MNATIYIPDILYEKIRKSTKGLVSLSKFLRLAAEKEILRQQRAASRRRRSLHKRNVDIEKRIRNLYGIDRGEDLIVDGTTEE